MQNTQMQLSIHAYVRLSQRSISHNDCMEAILYGRKFHATGVVFHFIGQKELNDCIMLQGDRERLNGLVVITDCSNQEIITTYKNKSALKEIKKKSKRKSRKYSNSFERGEYQYVNTR